MSMKTGAAEQSQDIGDLTRGLREIDGGWCVRVLPDGSACVDVLKMLFNYRLVLSPRRPGHGAEHPMSYSHGYCYFGHGEDAAGARRSMPAALLAAMSAAAVWDGTTDPPGFDKKVGGG
ncbi:hypothetical protein [Mycobacteroides chelonae]|nr:hypothetical protein [Mycobacteroides chelonae]